MESAITGTAGNDELTGTAASDVIRGLGGDDRIFGGDGFDILQGDAGNDQIFGGSSFDFIQGGEGNDLLLGSGWLIGNEGADIMTSTNSALFVGGAGGDLMSGSAGFDRFRYEFQPGESDAGNSDAIRFFEVGVDKIVLNVNNTGSTTSFTELDFIGDQSFEEWIDFIENSGQEIAATRSDNVVARLENNVLEIDRDFDGAADLTIDFIQDASSLSFNDFILI
ncbi:MAG: hypothetical protein HC844_15610 [Tabrizicola sp.]|nr:hypothetical protein [Tabrizicola sp.]